MLDYQCTKIETKFVSEYDNATLNGLLRQNLGPTGHYPRAAARRDDVPRVHGVALPPLLLQPRGGQDSVQRMRQGNKSAYA